MSERRTFRVVDVEALRQVFRRLRNVVAAGGVWSITVAPYRKARSIDQNSRYWEMLTRVSQAMPPLKDGVWYAPEIWHDYFRGLHLPVKAGPFGGKALTSTTKLNTVEMSEYQEKIEAWSAEQGIILWQITETENY